MEDIKTKIFEYGLTVKQLKEYIRDWPEKNAYGEPTTVWMSTGKNLTSQVKALVPLNRRTKNGEEWADLTIEPSQGFWEK